MEIQKETVVCPKCGHTWDTKAQGLWITCPHCMCKSIKEAMRKINLKVGESKEEA